MNTFTQEQYKHVLDLHKQAGFLPNPGLATDLQALVGQRVVVFSSTYFWRGRLVSVDAGSVRMREAELVTETGDFAAFVAGGRAEIAHPYPPGCEVRVNAGAIVAVFPISEAPK